MQQRTLRRPVDLAGVGLHSGKDVKLALRPAPSHFGIQFCRTDLPGRPIVAADFSNVNCTRLNTTLKKGDAEVRTVEHLMAALYGATVTNCLVEVDGPEVPILDGSARIFFEAIQSAGTHVQSAQTDYLKLKKEVAVFDGDKVAIARPSDQFSITAEIEWAHQVIGKQNFEFIEGITPFSEIIDARTFGFLKDVEMLKANGLIQGGSLDNAIVLDEKNVLNPEGLRYEDEFVRHKVLDAIGDFKLAGLDICASFELVKAGHQLHNQLLAKIFCDVRNFEYVAADSENKVSLPEKIEQIFVQASRVAIV